MWWIVMALAAPPEGVDPEDFGRWEEAADKALDGPAGCWELTGSLRVDAALHAPSTAFTRGDTMKMGAAGTWHGRLDGGQWTSFAYKWTKKDVEGDEFSVPVFPVIGKIDQTIVVQEGLPPEEEQAAGISRKDDKGSVSISIGGGEGGDGGAEAINLFQSAIDAWDPATATSMTEWRDKEQQISLLQDFPIFDTENSPVVVVESSFPGGGLGLSKLDAQFPRRVKIGEWPLKVNLMDTQFHLRQQQVGPTWLPQVEGFTLMAGVVGFTFGYEQQMVYTTAQACVSEG
jgi:hypothetical protein